MFKKIKEFKTDYLQLINCNNDFLELCFLHKKLDTPEIIKTIWQNIFDGLPNTFLKDGYLFYKNLIRINHYYSLNEDFLQLHFELLKDNKEIKQLKKQLINDLFNYLKNNYENYKKYLM